MNAADLALRDAQVEAVAREVFTTVGYAGATMDEISRRASVAKRTLYKAYGGKAGLFAMVVRASADPAPIPAFLDTLDSAQAVLQAVASNMVIAQGSQRGVDLLRMIIAEAPSQPELAGEVHTSGRVEAIASLTAVFARLFERGLLPAADAATAAELFVDMVIGGLMLNRLCCFDNALEQTIAARVGCFVRAFPALTAAEPAR